MISLDLNPPPPAKPKLPGWRTELRLEERRIELAAAAAAKAAADGAADGVVVNDDRISRWTPKQKGYYVYTFNVKEGEPVTTMPVSSPTTTQAPTIAPRTMPVSSPTTTQVPTAAPKTGRELQLHARNYNTRVL